VNSRIDFMRGIRKVHGLLLIAMVRFSLLTGAICVPLLLGLADATHAQTAPAATRQPPQQQQHTAASSSVAVAPVNAPASTLPAQPATKITYTDVNVDGPYIAMTFDDGPSGTNTPKLLDLAAKKHIKLTFFLVGECVADHPELVKREVAEGHEVANHSWKHPNLAKMSDEGVRHELQTTDDAISQAIGFRPKLMRPPYGELTQKQRLWVHNEFGYKVILWDVDPLDWKDRNASTVARRIIAGARPGSIILSHDIHATTVAAMPEVFDTLLAKGFKFVTVSELLAMDKGGSRPEIKETKEAKKDKAPNEDATKKPADAAKKPESAANGSPAQEGTTKHE
jgi:peptidoglycan-N-acetylglucosamine deacetylase